MDRRTRLALALAATLAAAPALAADDTLSGTLVEVDGDERSFTIQTSEGKRHAFLAPPAIDVEALEPGSELQVTAQPITEVGRDEKRRATAVAVLPDTDGEEAAPDEGAMPSDPASGGAPGGGPPSGGVPGGGVPSGGSPGGGIPSGGGAGGVGP
jgi:hypothetical protein